MTNYNDGNWHGWNGGDCPVHPKSMVEAVWHDPRLNTAGMTGPRPAKVENGITPVWVRVVKFRVVKEYREPRECWAVGKHMHDSLADAEAFRARVDAANPGHGHLDRPITHWREVVD